MTTVDAVIVGGGPAGSTCARRLRQAGWTVVVLDRQPFPRDKVCAGWLTPEVFGLLELDPEEYRATGLVLQEIRRFRTGVLGRPLIETAYSKPVSYAIRRYEFDHFLLTRAGARVLERTPLVSLQRHGDMWAVNGELAAPVVIGAGGHFCPVARHLQPSTDRLSVVVAKEAEVRLDEREERDLPEAPQLYFCRDLDGYAWCVRKGPFVNIGIGRRTTQEFGRHVDEFARFLARTGTFTRASAVKWQGHAYVASGSGARPLVADGVVLVGDAAGLAYPESGEGIRPAIDSGRLAAETLVAAAGRVTRDALEPYAQAIGQRYPPANLRPGPLHAAKVAAGRALLGSKLFTRHVMLDRWFLRRTA